MKKLALFTSICLAPVAVLAAEWSYEGKTGPEHWGSLSEEYAACDTGRLQSPFNIEQTFRAGLQAELTLSYDDVPLHIENTGHTLKIDTDDRSMKVGDEVYNLVQLHFHTPSEYTLNGKEYPSDVHFVHTRESDGALGVLGTFLVEGAANPALQKILDAAPEKKGVDHMKDVHLSLLDLIPEDREYLRFMGSLTTPPCSENVNWHVFTNPVEASKEQLKALKGFFGHTARPLQPANNRLVVGE